MAKVKMTCKDATFGRMSLRLIRILGDLKCVTNTASLNNQCTQQTDWCFCFVCEEDGSFDGIKESKCLKLHLQGFQPW